MMMMMQVNDHTLSNKIEDSTGKKAHVTDLIKQHITFPTTIFSPAAMFWLNN